MGWTKLQFINKAYSSLGYSKYQYDLDPEELNDALLDLDAMMAEWNAKNIRIGYPLPSEPENASTATETNVQDAANAAIYLNLAIRIAPALGKEVSQRLMKSAKDAYRSLYSKAVRNNVKEMDMPATMPRGAGQKYWRNASTPFVNDTEATDKLDFL